MINATADTRMSDAAQGPLRWYANKYGSWAFGLVTVALSYWFVFRPLIDQSRSNVTTDQAIAETLKTTSANLLTTINVVQDVAKSNEAAAKAISATTERLDRVIDRLMLPGGRP